MYPILSGSVVPGAGAFEVAAHSALTALKETVSTRARLGVQVNAISFAAIVPFGKWR